MPQNKPFKKTLSSHYDNVSINLDSKKLESFGSDDIDEFLRAPYKYIEDTFIIGSPIKDINILDYCCGNGSYSIIPALNQANVFGIDLSSKSIELANKRAKLLKITDNCFFKSGDAENLNFKDDFFELILCYGSLSYLDLDKCFKELKRVLKPGGKIVIVDSLGYNPIWNSNRKKNIKNYASNFINDLKTITLNDLNISLKHFDKYSIKYFDFFTVLGKFINNKFGIKISPKILIFIDNFFLKLPFINRMSFKFVCVIS